MESQRVINNAKWIVACKIAQSILQLIIGMLTARYLGPSDYGLVNYAKSLVAFVLPVMQLGLNSTLVQELIDNPEDEGRILGASLCMSLASGLLSMILVTAFVSVVNGGEVVTLKVCIIYSISLLFQATEVIQYWFHSHLNSRYPSLIMLLSYIVVSIYKIYLLITHKNIYWFASVSIVEYAVIAGMLLLAYNMQGIQKLKFSLAIAKQLFSKSKYYIMAAMMVTVFQNTDHIMLKVMAGDMQNGIYTSAITCSVITQFVYLAIIDSMRPVILESKKIDLLEYEKNISTLYCVIIYLALLQCVVFTVFAKTIINVLYGSAYIRAIPVLQVLIWHFVFSCIGVIRNIWILAENKHSVLWKINLFGAVANILLNMVLIPLHGALGAAVASVITQAFTNVLLGFMYKPLKYNNVLLLKGVSPEMLVYVIQHTKTIISQKMTNN